MDRRGWLNFIGRRVLPAVAVLALLAASLKLAEGEPSEVWFCGPNGLAEALKKSLKTTWKGRWRFHQEAFEMR